MFNLNHIFLPKECCGIFETHGEVTSKLQKTIIVEQNEYARHSDLWRDKKHISQKLKVELIFER